MVQDRLIDEIKQISPEKPAEVYDFVHYFRLGLAHEEQRQTLPEKRPIGSAKGRFQVNASFFEPLPDHLLDTFEN
ncbi:hypothetical protein [Thiocapsa sp. UBA6158]|jgi:hypothetical protein|uniref:hypothetical protein n=1 Tax=Thiocapsa sp. UBA6158 TaxID=1947692 RepID=UPI0025DA145B|nr:hypothetical protein [Thiocapsa sp. UBA6158]